MREKAPKSFYDEQARQYLKEHRKTLEVDAVEFGNLLADMHQNCVRPERFACEGCSDFDRGCSTGMRYCREFEKTIIEKER